MFRLEELGTTAFAGLALALQPTSMHTFLSYLFNPEELKGTLHDQWTRVLDTDFVETQIIDKMLSFKPEIDKLLSQLHTKAFGRAASPDPIRIPREVKANPVPASLNKLSLAELQAQQEARKERMKVQVASKYDSADEFQFATAARGSNLEAVREQIERERDAALHFDFKAKPVPHTNTSAAEVKLTAAAILREDALFKRKQEHEAAVIRAYESELRDPLEFYRWQANMQQQDEENYRREVETRRLEMVQAQFDAMEAARQAKLENREVAIEMKTQAKTRAVEREKEENELVEKYRHLTEDVKRVRDTAPREAEAQVREENARQRDALLEFLATERDRKAQQDAKERAAREDLIRQIRALDKVHREHVAVFDPTETAQLGLLEEMSLAELRERLRVRSEDQKRWEESRRDTILTDKQEKSADLLDKATSAARRRRATANETLRALVRHEQQRFAHARGTLQARNMYATNQTQNMTTQARLLSATRTKLQPKISIKNPRRNQDEQPQVT
ncbi:uncharacterized protein PITG_21258 [Phytophthora infestans T30-4]|uniref:Uncharacterized protein n=1 Tax=Phytophthora infestans (strain T30-4) TaxID=403677 RepID=D0P3Y6_PHYIT|nr:uncharacterized protein PITG_21258 [Phytophthora infestans T30-4]EEY62122.1 conserved hypothetical protein [Phytophthora infestans T30-4]|eukprot:XP_002894987.1 conserved hypothetical protein [Phytophthora infestans T30-4]